VQELDHARISSSAIHGNKSQAARQKALEAFKNGEIRVLVATDIAARGIDVDNISHVINYDLPNEPESYVHRIGRTARAGTGGIAFSFCDESEGNLLRSVEKVIKFKLTVVPTPPLEKMEPLPAAETVSQEQGRGENRFRKPARKPAAAKSGMKRQSQPTSQARKPKIVAQQGRSNRRP
jgi:ATP-dependent RNA helicase RhlE